MKKHTSKIISWIMILAMMFGMVPANMITAFAAGGNGYVSVEVSGNTAVATAESSHSDGANISIIAHKKGLEFSGMGYPAITVDTIEDDNQVQLTADNFAFNVDALDIGTTVSVTFPSGNAGDWVVVAYSDDSGSDLDITEVQIDTTGNVLAPLEYIYTTDLPAMTVGEAIAEIDVATATGGTAPLTYSATGLPAGLAISADGKITGTPTAKAAASAGTGITITVTDSATTPVTANATIGSAAIAEGVQTLSRKAGETVTSIFVGQTVQVTGESNVPAGENAILAYSGSTAVASVSAGGLVTGLTAGTVNVLIDSAATTNYGAATQLSVAIEVKAAGTNDLAITAVADPLQYGNEITMATTGGNAETVTWSSSNTTDALIGTDGKVTAANYTGTITITATQPAKADGSVAGSTVTTTVTLAPRVATVGAGDFAVIAKDYDKGTTATVTGALAVTNIVNSDDVTITGTTAAYADSNAGNDKTMTLSGSTLAGAKAAYYTLAGATMPAIKGDINKATIATAPTLSATTSKTATEIVLTAPTGGAPEGAGAAEYSKDNGANWQASATFTGLAAATEYTFVARWTADASGNYLPSAKSAEYKVTTENTPTYTIVAKTVPTFADITFGVAQPAAQDVVFTNSGNQTQTITATLEGADKGSFVITGTAANIAAGADATFSIQPNADLAAGTYTVQVKAISANNATGVTTTDITIVVNKATLAAPAAPTEHATTKPTATTITLATIAAPTGGTIEYACVEMPANVTGKTTGIFTGLSADREYTFTAKAIADASGNYADSAASAASAKIKTLNAPTYTFTLDKNADNFATDSVFGYTAQAAETITIRNTGNQVLTGVAIAPAGDSASFDISALSSTTIAAGATATFTVTPKTGLNAKTGAYTATYVVSATSATTAGADATFTATFEVAKAKITGTLNATKAYDGNANMTLAQIAAKELDGVNGDKFTLSTLTGATYSKADVHATTAAASKGTIAVTAVGGALVANYDVTDVTGITINGAITEAPITGKPAITGKPIFGETLTASVAGVTPSTGLTYLWKANGVAIAGAMSATLVLAADQVGKTITVEVTASGNYSGSAESAATAVVTKKSITGAVSITDKNAGTLVVGDALAADLSGVIPADAQRSTYTYSWKNGSTEVGTAAEYTVKAGDTSITLTITVDSADARFDGFLTSAAVEPGKTALVSVGIPTSDNGTVWGSTLTAGAIDPIGAQTEVDYQWMSNGTNVGTNSSSYTTVIGDVGKTITVKITPKATSTAYSGSATSLAFGPMTNQAQTAPSPTTTVGGPYYDKVVVNTVVGQEYLINTANDVTTNSPAWIAATGTTHEFTGLTAGTPYYVFTRLAAKTGYDASPASSSATQATKTLAVPGAPENLVVTAGNKTLTVSWKAPTDDGGSAITKYTVQLDATPAIEVTSGTTHTFTDLTNDTLYNITVATVNAQGTGANATGSGTPKAQSGGGTSDTSPAPTPTEFVVSFEAGTNGKITSGETKVSVKADAMVEKTPTVVAADGFTFKGWSIDGKTVVDPKTVKITKATTFTALYEIDDIFFNKSLKGSYIEGYEDSTFGPQKPITRAEVAEIIARTLSKQMEEGKTYSTNFTDVDSSKWYANAIGFLADVGVVDGYEDATFRPNSNISRAEFISLVIKVDGLVSGTNSFSDVDPSVWYAEYIISAAAKNIVNGYADGTFRPTQSVTRAEVVKIINVVLARAAEKGEMKFTDVDSTHWAYDEIVAASK